MRKIDGKQIGTFLALLTPAVAVNVALSYALWLVLPPGDMRGALVLLAWLLLLPLCAIVACRLFLTFNPMRDGSLDPGSREEWIYHVYTLFSLMFFQPLTRSLLVPVPIMRALYQLMGAKLGDNTYSGGTILDPPLVRIGSNTIIGHDAVLFSHAMEGSHLALASIEIGDRVTIGAKAVIMPGVKIGDGAIVAVNAVVLKGTEIGPGERWAGIPAKRLGSSPAAKVPKPDQLGD